MTEADARVLSAMAADIALLRIAVERLVAAHAGRPLTTADAAAAARLWPAIAEHFPDDRVFLAGELVRFASAPLSTRCELRAALLASIGGTLDAGAPRRLGKFLRRLADVQVGAWRIERLAGCDRAGALWMLRRVSEPTKPDDSRAHA